MREIWAKRIAFLTGLMVLLLTVLFATLQTPVETAERGDAALPGDTVAPATPEAQCVQAGRQVYQDAGCALCHSIAGQGNPRSPLDGVGARLAAPDLKNWIIGAQALKGQMPARAFERKQAYRDLPDEDLQVLVIYLQSLHPEATTKTGTDTSPAAPPDTAVTGEDGTCLPPHANPVAGESP